jgi:hypothetical protein
MPNQSSYLMFANSLLIRFSSSSRALAFRKSAMNVLSPIPHQLLIPGLILLTRPKSGCIPRIGALFPGVFLLNMLLAEPPPVARLTGSFGIVGEYRRYPTARSQGLSHRRTAWAESVAGSWMRRCRRGASNVAMGPEVLSRAAGIWTDVAKHSSDRGTIRGPEGQRVEGGGRGWPYDGGCWC